MDRKSLFDLPKELLVEIILNVKKKHNKEMEMLFQYRHGDITRCEKEGCTKFKVRHYEGHFSTLDEDDNLVRCDVDDCRKDYCDSHNIIYHSECCGSQQCSYHHQCELCKTPICLWCSINKSKCENCILVKSEV